MFLSNRDIENLLRKGTIKIKPLKKEQIGPASIDLTLSGEWYFFKEKYINSQVDLSKTGFKEAIRMVKSKTIVLQPGEMCLGKTVEKITLAPNIIGMLEGRSRYARMGLSVHITSALVQPGSSNHQVLEIVNSAPFSVTLTAGMRVSQIIFSELRSNSTKPYSKFGNIAKRQ